MAVENIWANLSDSLIFLYSNGNTPRQCKTKDVHMISIGISPN